MEDSAHVAEDEDHVFEEEFGRRLQSQTAAPGAAHTERPSSMSLVVTVEASGLVFVKPFRGARLAGRRFFAYAMRFGPLAPHVHAPRRAAPHRRFDAVVPESPRVTSMAAKSRPCGRTRSPYW